MQISCEFASDFFEKRLHYCTTIALQISCDKPANRRAASDEKPTPGHSTELASVRFVNDLIQQMDTFNIPISILIDLSKAFDTLDHKIMLSKLRYYGISGVELNFFP